MVAMTTARLPVEALETTETKTRTRWAKRSFPGKESLEIVPTK